MEVKSVFVTAVLFSICSVCSAQVSEKHDLRFESLANSWDEGIPLGNGMVGALIWQKGNNLRLSLDRADLWDLHPVKEFERPEFSYSWVRDQVLKKDYKPVQELFDLPYERDPYPTKIPAGALEFDISALGDLKSVELQLGTAVCRIEWKNGARLRTFVHAKKPLGWFRFENLPTQLIPRIIPPPYASTSREGEQAVSSLNPSDLGRLGYPPPVVESRSNSISYHQIGYGGLTYDVYVEWRLPDERTLEGVWSITASYKPQEVAEDAQKQVRNALMKSLTQDLSSHTNWWNLFWRQSSIRLPDSVLETQWYREMYKFGSAARRGSPPITLQAIWTADNGRLPPWKGDFHNDLNTQLSYWPSYSGNHLEEGLSFTDWLWNNKAQFERYTKKFFAVDGLNVPGVCTLTGEPLGGWIQYSDSPTCSAWLAHHFYSQWRFSMDRKFLEERAYPWVREVAIFLDNVSEKSVDGKRKLPLSSSPEINDNNITAWFQQTTNYDLSLIRWLYSTALELAKELGKKDDELRWLKTLSEWPELARSEVDGRLLVAPDYPLKESHRHFSHLMAIYPLGILSYDKGEADRAIMKGNLAELRRLGPDWWCGYSYSWLGSITARAQDGEAASEALRTFATCFCLPNSFHVNGDQSKTGKSKFTYRPFTLEGNFAFAEGINEMLLQSNAGMIKVFPAVPWHWREVSFTTLRAEGALLISATRIEGLTTEVRILPEVGGTIRIKDPFYGREFDIIGIKSEASKCIADVIELQTTIGKEIILKAK